ncbi:MAG: phospholipase D-like domain-containing protein [bacterium]|nr:phospholipase D-like domain-containing protein [bacterium]
MAKFLTTKGSSAALEEIIRKAKKEIYLISYSFQISDIFISRIKEASERGIIVKLIYGKQIDSVDLIKDIKNLQICYCPNMHAKIYANESICIIGSMNFYEYSEKNNFEAGILLNSKEDEEAFAEAIQECQQILKVSQLSKSQQNNQNSGPKLSNNLNTKSYKMSHKGFCIRTGVEIPFNINKPFCKIAYDEWSWWSNGDYEESFCHYSGEPSNGQTSFNHPVLYKNYADAVNLQNSLNFF